MMLQMMDKKDLLDWAERFEMATGSPFIRNFRLALDKYPDLNLDCMSRGQLKSKQWLIEELSNVTSTLGLTFLLGGWYGTLAAMMFESNKFDNLKIRSFDIDPSCANIADTINRTPYVMEGWRFKASTADMYKLDYDVTTYTTKRFNGTEETLQDSPDTIINTSCEHLEFFDIWWDRIPANKLIILQSNNFVTAKDHVNCVHTLEDFKLSAPMNEILFEGILELEEYTRFMLIGRK